VFVCVHVCLFVYSVGVCACVFVCVHVCLCVYSVGVCACGFVCLYMWSRNGTLECKEFFLLTSLLTVLLRVESCDWGSVLTP
jgi:hypothetical protein